MAFGLSAVVTSAAAQDSLVAPVAGVEECTPQPLDPGNPCNGPAVDCIASIGTDDPAGAYCDQTFRPHEEKIADQGDSVDRKTAVVTSCESPEELEALSATADQAETTPPRPCRTSDGGITYYVTKRRVDQGEVFSGNYNHKYENWMHRFSCTGSGCGAKSWLNDSRNRQMSGYTRFDGSSDDQYVGLTFSRVAARPYCSVEASNYRGYATASCFYRYG